MKRRARDEGETTDLDGFPLDLITEPDYDPADVDNIRRFWAARRAWEDAEGRTLPYRSRCADIPDKPFNPADI